MTISTEVLNKHADIFVKSLNESPGYGIPLYRGAHDNTVFYPFLLDERTVRTDGWLQINVWKPYKDMGGTQVFFGKPIQPPEGENPDGNWWKFRVYDPVLDKEEPMVAGYMDLTTAESGAEANWMGYIPEDLTWMRLDDRWDYGPSLIYPGETAPRPIWNYIFEIDLSFNGFRGNADLGVAWKVRLPDDPRISL